MTEKISKILHLYSELEDEDKQKLEDEIYRLFHYWNNCLTPHEKIFLTFKEIIDNHIDFRKYELDGAVIHGGLPECHDYFLFLPDQEIKSALRFVSLNFASSNELFDFSEIDSQSLSHTFQALTLQLALQEICNSFSQENIQTYKRLLREGNKILYNNDDKNQSSSDFPKMNTVPEN